MNIKKQGWESNHKKYKANKNTKIQAIKKHNNQDTINTQIKQKTINEDDVVCHKSINNRSALVAMCGRDEECIPI